MSCHGTDQKICCLQHQGHWKVLERKSWNRELQKLVKLFVSELHPCHLYFYCHRILNFVTEHGMFTVTIYMKEMRYPVSCREYFSLNYYCITNEALEISTWNLVQRWIVNISTLFVWNIDSKLKTISVGLYHTVLISTEPVLVLFTYLLTNYSIRSKPKKSIIQMFYL
jgi:hypothetical protein